MNPRFAALLATDLDGTLLAPDRRAGDRDLALLRELPAARVCRAVVTGRTLDSARRVLPPDFPIDYLVFSSGVGILDWATGELLLAHEIPAAAVARALAALRRLRANFAVHLPVPDNHRFLYHESVAEDTDFRRRCQHEPAFAAPLEPSAAPSSASQLLAVIPPDLARFAAMRDALPGLEVVRTTSPVDGRSIWVEIFPPGVSKASGCQWLAEFGAIPRQRTYCLGNDYNDLHMLEWSHHPAVVANAPADLRARFPVVASHADNPLADAWEKWALRNAP